METGRSTTDRADSTGAPVASTALSDTASPPAPASRSRSIDAPPACRHTSPQESGDQPLPAVSSPAKGTACNAASSSAGCNPNSPAPLTCSGKLSSANTSPSEPRQAARRPWNAGP
ncbi:hypothetical protein Amac_038230 [Acrocarpospora macrocephala]|uniref:Uncharacterized protein n=1 Tax=Acrocarpospora macrocephala TaxID=150177 RepID=A0A5M3WNP4_9ACTN|nr:hypothetical protein Amac_038230 [Acrocarpospora macrocephala]